MATTTFIRTVHKQLGTKTASVQRCLYIQREGQYAPLDYITGEANPQGRDDLIHTKAVNLPDWAHDSASRFFALAAEYERANGIVSTEWKFALPRELNRSQQLAAAADALAIQLDTTHPYVWAMHEPHASDQGTNPHVHAIFSSRTLDGIERSPDQFFRRYNPEHPERGGALKNGTFHAFGAVKDQRRTYTDVLNLHLERAGSRARLHPERLSTRGFEREPEPRAWPSDSYDLKHNQTVTTRWQKILDHRQLHQEHHTEEHADAFAYWEHRKQRLGITRHVSHELALERIAEARSRSLTTPPRQRSARALEHEALGLRHELATLEREERQRTRRGRDVHPWTREPDHGHGYAIRARVFDRSREHEGPGYDR